MGNFEWHKHWENCSWILILLVVNQWYRIQAAASNAHLNYTEFILTLQLTEDALLQPNGMCFPWWANSNDMIWDNKKTNATPLNTSVIKSKAKNQNRERENMKLYIYIYIHYIYLCLKGF